MILTKPLNARKGLYIKRLAEIVPNSLATLKNSWVVNNRLALLLIQ